MTKYAAKFVQ